MTTTDADLRKAIAEILEEADINKITAKKVRAELEVKLKTDLSSKKKEIDKLVMDIINAKNNQEEDDESEEELEEEKPARKRGGRVTRKSTGKKGKDEDEGKKKKVGRAGGTGFTKVLKLSPELAAVMGEPALARHEVVKKVWAMIKEQNLYDPKNKQFAICNDELLPIFGIKRFRTFGMMKYLKNHFIID